MYEVNGTARPVHRADVAVVATNGGFTQAAREFADLHNIRLLGREELTRWATLGADFHAVLGLGNHAQAG